MKHIKIVLAFLGSVITLASCSGGTSSNTEIESCASRGVAYFKEIGSYPTLNSAPNKGRAAEDVALERCNRTTTAF